MCRYITISFACGHHREHRRSTSERCYNHPCPTSDYSPAPQEATIHLCQRCDSRGNSGQNTPCRGEERGQDLFGGQAFYGHKTVHFYGDQHSEASFQGEQHIRSRDESAHNQHPHKEDRRQSVDHGPLYYEDGPRPGVMYVWPVGDSTNDLRRPEEVPRHGVEYGQLNTEDGPRSGTAYVQPRGDSGRDQRWNQGVSRQGIEHRQLNPEGGPQSDAAYIQPSGEPARGQHRHEGEPLWDSGYDYQSESYGSEERRCR